MESALAESLGLACHRRPMGPCLKPVRYGPRLLGKGMPFMICRGIWMDNLACVRALEPRCGFLGGELRVYRIKESNAS